jgi:hypothetical protein
MTDRRYTQRGTYQWPNDNWGWIAAALVGAFMLGGVAVESYGGPPRVASFLEDATTGQSTRPSANAMAPAPPALRPLN